MNRNRCHFLNAIGCLAFIGLLLFMAGVELNPGPITPSDDKTEKQEQPIPAPPQTGVKQEQPIPTPAQTGVKQEQPIPTPHQTGVKQEQPIPAPPQTGVQQDQPIPAPHQTGVKQKQPISAPHQTGVKQKQPISAPPQTPSEQEVPLLTDETEPKQYIEPRQVTSVLSTQAPHEEPAASFHEPLREPELVELAPYITYDKQQRIAVMLGFDLDKVETLRSKHRENVTEISMDLLIDWMICNPQPTNRMVN